MTVSQFANFKNLQMLLVNNSREFILAVQLNFQKDRIALYLTDYKFTS